MFVEYTSIRIRLLSGILFVSFVLVFSFRNPFYLDYSLRAFIFKFSSS